MTLRNAMDKLYDCAKLRVYVFIFVLNIVFNKTEAYEFK